MIMAAIVPSSRGSSAIFVLSDYASFCNCGPSILLRLAVRDSQG
jgi:hypothetical protein